MQIKEIILKTTMDMEQNLGSLEVFVETENERSEQEKIFLWAQLVDEQKEEADRIFPMELEENTQFCMEVKNPKLWNTEYPYLYELILELRDEENRLLGCTSKLAGFYHVSEREGKLVLNGQSLSWNRAKEMSQMILKDRKRVEEYLLEMKEHYYNCIYIPSEWLTPQIQGLCVEYGILLLDKDQAENIITDAGDEKKENPDFGIQVVEDGVLIENKTHFTNTNVYALRCEILSENRALQISVLEADVPAGSSRYLEVPFIKPQNPGMYRYRVSLCLKKDTAWGKKGDPVAMGETMISNLWLG